MIGSHRRAHGTIDRELIVFETEVDGQITADGPLETKWADRKQMKASRKCVILDAVPTERNIWEKCCYSPFSLWVCQSMTTAANQAVVYTVESVPETGPALVVASFTVVGVQEKVLEFNNATMQDGEEVFFKNLRVSVALNGGPIEGTIWFSVGNC